MNSRRVPQEIIEHLYKKEYGLTTREFLSEPIDRVANFMKIKEYEGVKNEKESNKSKQHNWKKDKWQTSK